MIFFGVPKTICNEMPCKWTFDIVVSQKRVSVWLKEWQFWQKYVDWGKKSFLCLATCHSNLRLLDGKFRQKVSTIFPFVNLLATFLLPFLLKTWYYILVLRIWPFQFLDTDVAAAALTLSVPTLFRWFSLCLESES